MVGCNSMFAIFMGVCVFSQTCSFHPCSLFRHNKLVLRYFTALINVNDVQPC